MRIASLCQSYPPMISGASHFAEMLAIGMTERGHEVLVIAASDSGRKYLSQSNRLTVLRVRSRGNPLRAQQRYAAFALRDVLNALETFRPNVIHLHDVFSIAIAGLVGARRAGIPVLLTAHQLPEFVTTYLPPLPGLAVAIEALLWRYAALLSRYAHVVAPSPDAARQIRRRGGFLAEVIGYGLNFTVFHPSRDPHERFRLCCSYGLDPDLPIILHTGRLDADKSVHRVIEAAARPVRMLGAQLLIVGDGSQKMRLQKLSRQLGIDKSVVFTGFVRPDGDLPGLYRSADVFVTASEIETQGIVILEAMASGLPVAAFRATCLPEIIRNGSNGLLVPPGDVEALGSALCAMIADPDWSRQMGAEGKRIAAGYSCERSVSEYEKVYHRLQLVPRPVVRPKASLIKRPPANW